MEGRALLTNGEVFIDFINSFRKILSDQTYTLVSVFSTYTTLQGLQYALLLPLAMQWGNEGMLQDDHVQILMDIHMKHVVFPW